MMTERTSDLSSKMKMALGDLEISDLDSKERSWDRTAKWYVKVSPVDHVDLADLGIKKAMNISQGSAFFYIGKGNKREGQMMFLFNQYKDAQLIVNKLACIPFKSEVVNVHLKRKKSKTNTIPEVGELSIYTKSATNLAVPIRGKEATYGKPINRRLLLRNVPVGTSREMIEVMVPYTLSVKFQALKAGETTGVATLECSSPAVSRAVKKCYSGMKLGKHDLVIHREGTDEEEQKEKSNAKSRPANSSASSRKDSPSGEKKDLDQTIVLTEVIADQP
ncbi:uncharacterized protein LOC124284141 [Haliotis rubra]|uniref:uncharacterized protein LOC124284141 n=1 Tax=Haliotis rubra TaxID=36100 RepID=UPI001EE5CCD8|nr:uncharacterized protein LOC124284141 [Haliotis rubra]